MLWQRLMSAIQAKLNMSSKVRDFSGCREIRMNSVTMQMNVLPHLSNKV